MGILYQTVDKHPRNRWGGRLKGSYSQLNAHQVSEFSSKIFLLGGAFFICKK
jgi:hypothetical protein